MAQDKLVRVSRGRILDVVVDLRTNSKTFGKSLTLEISAEKWNQIFVPVGFAHGLITLEDNTEVHYKVSNFYAPEHDKGILWSDPVLNIDWGVDQREVLVSPKDQVQPKLSQIKSPF
jgi:dTDP-4-dehydrorhamnose 3,5-epimerase